MAFALILDSGPDYLILRMLFLHRSATNDYAGTTIPVGLLTKEFERAPQLIDVPKICHDMNVYFITENEKRERRKRGWRPYFFPPVVAPMRPVFRFTRSRLGSRNIGCKNFRRAMGV